MALEKSLTPFAAFSVKKGDYFKCALHRFTDTVKM